MQKREFKTIGGKKSVAFIYIQHMKVIQDALLYNKIECYNKRVQRSPSLSAKGCITPQDIYTAPDIRCLEERRRKTPFFLHWIISQLINVEPIERWLYHDAWCKHWRSLSPIEDNSVSRGQNVEEHSDPTRPTGVGRNPSLNKHLHHQKVIHRAWSFRRCHSFE